MLKPAINYVDQLNKLKSIVFDNEDKYKYYINNNYINFELFDIGNNDYGRIHQVSINSKDEVQGYFSATMDYPNGVSSLAFLNFYVNSKKLQVTFIRDMLAFIDYLFMYRNVSKIKWTVVIGNPAEKLYDSFCEKFNGRIVGTFKNDVQLIDMSIHDVKHYELMRDDYIKANNDPKRTNS